MGEGEVCVTVLNDGGMKNANSLRIESKREHEWLGDNTEAEPCTKKLATEALNDTELESCASKQVKEASNDDICSELSNPNLSPRHNACSFQIISSQQAELVGNNQVGSGEISSTCSGNSSTEESLSEEDQFKNDTSAAVSTFHFILEIPKDVSSIGIRKSTFKFSKRMEDYDNQLSVTAVRSVTDGVCHSFQDDMNAEMSTRGKLPYKC